jgi:hypothetical protein
MPRVAVEAMSEAAKYFVDVPKLVVRVGEEIARRFLSSASPGSYYKDNIQEEFTIRRVR